MTTPPTPHKTYRILVIDFDGVIHSYTSPWDGPTVILDPPVPGALDFIVRASEDFIINIYSSRSHDPEGIEAMKDWLAEHWGEAELPRDVFNRIRWPDYKPAAFVTIDDRAIQFDGTWPSNEELTSFKPWNKR